MKALSKMAVLLLLTISSQHLRAQEQTTSAADSLEDCEGCADDSAIGRYPHSHLVGYQKHAFDRTTFLTARLPDAADRSQQSVVVEGRRTQLFYFAPQGRSGLEVFLNYKQSLVQAGYSIIWTCSGYSECGGEFANIAVDAMHLDLDNTTEAREGISDAEEPRYLVAKKQDGPSRTVIAVLAADLPLHAPPRAGAFVVVAQDGAMDRGLMVANQSKLEHDLESAGMASVYGIRFDFDRATIRPESEAQLEEIAKLLARRVKDRLLIVGHTDSVGSDAHNLELSTARASAVKEWLVTHGIAADRLRTEGKGSAEPLATNDTDAGREKNRRVELRRED